MNLRRTVEDHPNASVAVVSTGPATLIVWLIDTYVQNIPPAVGAAIAGVILSIILATGRTTKVCFAAIGKYGLRGIWRRILDGEPPPNPPPPP